jgi:hypothetical protein
MTYTPWHDKEAEIEAFGRLTAMRASAAIARRLQFKPDAEVPERIQVLDGEGRVLFEADLWKEEPGE